MLLRQLALVLVVLLLVLEKHAASVYACGVREASTTRAEPGALN